MIIKNFINNQVDLYALKLFIKGYKQEKLIKKINSEVSKIDSISDYDSFCDAITPYLKRKTYLTHSIYGAESFHYGHLNELYHYAGIQEKPSGKLFPVMEHAAAYQIVRHRSKDDILRNVSYLYQSEYMKKYIHDIDLWKPVFCIGCYLHYVRPYYSTEKEQTIKGQYGKTLLVIASHNLETQNCQYGDEEFVDFVMKFAKDNCFDTVMVSAYFCDINLDMYKNFREKGAIIVSAGFREDPNFIRRLKTIFSLSDMVMSNAIGSPVGFSKYMNKPYLLVQKEVELINQKEAFSKSICLDNQLYIFDKLRIISSKMEHSQEELQYGEQLYDYYSGRKELIRTPEEIAAIVSIVKCIYKKSHGYSIHFDRVVENELNRYQKEKDEMKYRLLKEALEN